MADHRKHEPMTGKESDESFAAGQRSTWISVAVNAVLTLGQIIIGINAHAQSLVADGMHSLSDMVSDFFVIFANKRAREPADENHPYGHGRIETAASFFLGVALLAVGLGFLFSAAMRLQHSGMLPAIDPIALWAALFTLAAKEVLFRYQLAVAERVRSPMLVANAWHQRADAASSLVVAAGIGGSLAGFPWGDMLASIIVGFMIARMGLRFAWDAMQELIDTGLTHEETEAICQTVRETPGVLGLHELRTRRMARHVLVDAHILVGARISVSEGHHIAEDARCRVLGAHAEVLDVLVHIDPEEDRDKSDACAIQPGRAQVLEVLQPLIQDMPTPNRVLLHYLGGRVQAEVYFDHDAFSDPGAMVAAEKAIALKLEGNPSLHAVSLNTRVAPK